MADRVAPNQNAPVCCRCGNLPTRDNPLDRLTLAFDDDHLRTALRNVCRACGQALLQWLDPPADVREARAKQRVTHTIVQPHRASPVARVQRPAPQAVVEEDDITYDTSEVDAKELVRQIDSLLAGENGVDYEWASDTLNGIRDSITTKAKPWRATPEQQRAVDNVEEGGIRGARRGRY